MSRITESLYDRYSLNEDVSLSEDKIIHDVVDDGINNIFYNIQTELGFESGDVDPVISFHIDEIQEKLENLLAVYVDWYKTWFSE